MPVLTTRLCLRGSKFLSSSSLDGQIQKVIKATRSMGKQIASIVLEQDSSASQAAMVKPRATSSRRSLKQSSSSALVGTIQENAPTQTK